MAATALAVGTLGPLAAAPPASAARADLVGNLDTRAQQTSTVLVPVPDGVRPRWVTGALTVGDDTSGTVLLLVDGAVAASVPAKPSQRVAVPVRRSDVRPDGTVELGVRFRPEGDRSGCRPAQPYDVRLADLTLLHQGAEAVDLDPAGFLPDAASRVDVVVPRAAPDDVLAAGLATVAALAARYPADVPVGLTTADVVLPRTGAGQRVLRISPGDGAPTTATAVRHGLPTATVTGSGEELRGAAVGLVRVEAPPARPAAGAGGTARRTLTDLGATGADTTLTGYGRSVSALELRQDAFGGSVDRLDVDLTGTTSAAPAGTGARLDTYLDGRLLDSRPLAEGGPFRVAATIPGSRLGAGSELQVVLTAVPEDGCTAGDLPPLEVRIDPEASVLTGRLDPEPESGFAQFPQVLAGVLPVALRGDGPDRTAAATGAALLVASLQRAASHPLEVELVEPADLLDGDRSGLLVGATAEDSAAAGTALLPDPDGAPGAALQAGDPDGLPLLVLGDLGPDSAGLALRLAEQADRDGWETLTGDALVSDGGAGRPVADLDPSALPGVAAAPGADGTDAGDQRSWARWLLGAAAALVLLLFGLLATRLAPVLRRRRPARPARPARTEEAPRPSGAVGPTTVGPAAEPAIGTAADRRAAERKARARRVAGLSGPARPRP